MQNKISHPLIAIIWTFLFILSNTTFGATSEDTFSKHYSPSVGKSYPTNVYWGDTHLHSNLSFDAYRRGNQTLQLGLAEAYRFSRGESITLNNGIETRLHRPLDFLVIADHAENMGVMRGLDTADPVLLKTDVGKLWYSKFHAKDDVNTYIWETLAADPQIVRNKTFRQSIWEEVTAMADKYNEPGKFTAFIGFEWSAGEMIRNQNKKFVGYASNHRVVVFKDDAEKANQVLPYSLYDSGDPGDLWRYLESYENKVGGNVLAITHDGNLSGGKMFATEDFTGWSISRDYAQTRMRWEPLYEVTQSKGDSETHPLVSPVDEFANFEKWGSNEYEVGLNRKNEYARSALKLGLQQQARLGINPFKFGMIGSTDSHTSLSGVAENNYVGINVGYEPNPGRIEKVWRANAAGYAAVWAEENTRQSLFAAMKRKEVYASTGPRMTVRFFGGWDYQSDDAFRSDLAKIGYGKGVPMGGDLTSAPKGKSPDFLIRAVKDPDGANLDRVQVIKGWHDKSGELHEKIYDIALSDNRKQNRQGKVKPVGNTVDVKNASYTNSIGDPELAVVWTDPDFNKNELAFYYVRVLEIPTPRWTAYDAKYFGLKNVPKEVPMVTQERVYTSPIWYIPADE